MSSVNHIVIKWTLKLILNVGVPEIGRGFKLGCWQSLASTFAFLLSDFSWILPE
jgi:hypothetical protein